MSILNSSDKTKNDTTDQESHSNECSSKNVRVCDFTKLSKENCLKSTKAKPKLRNLHAEYTKIKG